MKEKQLDFLFIIHFQVFKNHIQNYRMFWEYSSLEVLPNNQAVSVIECSYVTKVIAQCKVP